MARSAVTTGLFYAFSSGVLWALFPVLTTMSVLTVPPLLSAAYATFFAALFFATIITIKKEWRMVPPECARDIAVATVLIGILFYGLTFLGIKYTSPGNAAITGMMEVFFSFLFVSVLLRHERLVPSHVFGASLMVLGSLFILLPHSSGFRGGDIIILIASVFPPLGNMAMQRARKVVSTSYIMFWRSLVGGVFLLVLSFFLEPSVSLVSLKSALPTLILNGLFLLGLSKIFWVEALHRLPVTQTISVASIQPLFTMLFAYLILKQDPTLFQLISFFPIAIGMVLLTKSSKQPLPNLE